MKIVVIGGTGLIGSKLVAGLTEQGHAVVAASPDPGVDTLTGEGLAEVLDGAATVVDVSNTPPPFEGDGPRRFFETSTRNLLAAEGRAGVGHHVALSVVGTNRLPASDYFRAKLAQEALIAGSPIPYSIVHATQFFEFLDPIANGAAQEGVVHLAPVLIQPMAADDVAAAVGRVATGEPVNGIVEVGGPEQFRLDDLIRDRLRAAGDPRRVVADPHAPYFGAELEERTLVPGPEAQLAPTGYAEWARRTKAAA
jgi:uncharacterized protein YbjT (DUF2867 family)